MIVAIIAASLVLVAGITTAAIVFLSPTPAEHVANVVRAVSADSSQFKTASDDVIAESVSKVCSSQAAIGNMRPGTMMWGAVSDGTPGMHPEAVSREDFVDAVNEFCASER